MKVSRVVHFTWVCLGLLVSCAYPHPATPGSPIVTPSPSLSTIVPSSTLPTSIDDTPVPTHFQPSPTLSPQVTPGEGTAIPLSTYAVPAQYELNAIFDYNQHALSVSEAIHYMNYTTETITDLVLVVEPNRWPGGFSLDSIAWEGGEKTNNYELMDDQLHIPLPQPLKSGESFGLKINYQLELPAIPAPSEVNRPVPYGYSARQTNIVDWYAYVPPYRVGEGWLVHPRWWFGENQVFTVADFQVKVTLTEPVQDLLIAAPAPAIQDGDSYSYHLEGARSFALSASTEYLLQTTMVGDVTIHSYVFPFDKSGGQEVLQSTADALELYSDLIMPYPHTSLSVVEADFLDGMEYDGLFFLSHGFFDLYDGTPKGYLTFIAAHETAHQWWYSLVGNDQALEPWLDEALCTYMERIFYEKIYADYPSDSGVSLVDWWWYYRVNFYNPSGWVDGSIYDFNQFRPYRDAIYLNGAKFLEDLRNLIGDQAFFAFLRDYAHQNDYGIATAADFFTILRAHTSKNLDGLTSNYFQHTR
jgi:Peptidase family M1 domain